MRLSSWLRTRATHLTCRRDRHTSRRWTLRPWVEWLEDRTAPAVFTVTNTGDNGGVNPAPFAGTGTLRQAIIDAEAASGADSITFAIPDSLKTAGHDWWTIQPTSELPHLTDTVTIDGWSQGGAGYHGPPKIMLDGANAGNVNGITVYDNPAVPDGCVFRGLAIGNFFQAGIANSRATNTGIQGCYLGLDPAGTTAVPNTYGIMDAPSGSGTLIGGSNPGEGNVISGNTFQNLNSSGHGVTIRGNFVGTNAAGTAAVFGSDGIRLGFVPGDYGTNTIANNLISGGDRGILLTGVSHVRILGNLIGTDVTGMHALGNRLGIFVQGSDGGSSDVVIGGADPGSRNVISASSQRGIEIQAGPGTVVQGNYIGTDVNGAPTLGNGLGVNASHDCLIGGMEAGAGNLIAGNLGAGVGCNGSNDQVIGNVIYANGGEGVGSAGTNNQFIGNVIHDNGGAGIQINGGAGAGLPANSYAEGNIVSANSIYANGGLGIDLEPSDPNTGGLVYGVTLNNSMGHDGPNHFQNFPVLTSAFSSGNRTSISGTFDEAAEPNTAIRIEFFASPQADPTGYGEGQTYLGWAQVTTDANGHATFSAADEHAASTGTAGGLDPCPAGQVVLSATATNLSTGDTSEFSLDGVLTVATLTSSANPSALGQPVTFTATLSAAASGFGTVGGSVDFVDTTTGTDLGTVALSGGSASVTISSLTAGTHVIQAVYGGNGTFLSSTATTTQSVAPSSLSGIVWEDFNDDGQVDFGEKGIDGVTITLTGTDFLSNPVNQSQTTSGGGAYSFLNLLPGSYYITETQPAGYAQGIDSVGTAGGSLSATDQFLVQLAAGVNGLNYNFGEQPAGTGPVQHGQTAGIGFWNNKNGQALILALNGGGSSHQLGDWLAATLPHMFGASAGGNDLAGKGNAYVAALFQSDFVMKGVKLDAQVLATALAVYVTNATLDPTQVAASYGFIVSGDGVGAATWNVGSAGDAFGVANNTTLTVMDLLLATDNQAINGLLYNGNTAKRNEANAVYSALNQAGSIG